MENTQIAISSNGKTTLATAGRYCERNIDINVAVASAGADIPAYVKAEADSLVAKVVSAQGNRVFKMAAITDMHYGNGSYTDGILHAAQALAYINDRVPLDAFAVLGDYTDGYPVDDVDNSFSDCRKINSLLAPMEGIPNLRIQGNHDFYSGYAQFVHYHIQAFSEGVTWGDKVGGYFYRDFADKKLRIICVNSTETDNVRLTVSDAQYNWFIGALDLSAKTDASDWQILILSHHPLDWYATTYVFGNIVDAYNSGGSWSGGNISCNFAGKNAATLIGNIHGHIHNLLIDKIHIGNVVHGNRTAVTRIATPEACVDRANQYNYDGWGEATTYHKVRNTADDTSIVVYCIDLDEQNIKAFCYGAGYDREINYAATATPAYTNQIPLSINADGTPYVGTNGEDGYKTGFRLNTSGGETATTSTTNAVTGFIPCTPTSVIRFRDVPMNYNTSEGAYLAFYDANFAVIKSQKIQTGIQTGDRGLTFDGAGYLTSIDNPGQFVAWYGGAAANIKYVRVSADSITASSVITVITVNEEIE